MSTARRIAVLIGLMTALVIGTTVPASAQFAASTTVTTSVATATVAPPTGVQAQRVGTCQELWGFPVSMTARVTWQPSPSPRVSGYRVTGTLFGNAALVNRTYPAGTTTAEFTATPGLTYKVTAITDYGWTADSAATGRVSC